MSSISNKGRVVGGVDISGSVIGGGEIFGVVDNDDDGDVATLD